MEANPVIALYLTLGIIILAARAAGTLSRRFGQPRVLGELLVGVLLGPTVIDLLHVQAFGLDEAHLEGVVDELAELGVLLLMFKVGLDVHLSELAKVGRVAGLAGVTGALLPVALAVPAVMAFNYAWEPALFAGVVLAATSVSISAQVLLELGVLQTRVGNALLATALIDDVIAILLVSLAVAFTGPQQNIDSGALMLIVARMALYIVAAFALAWFALPRMMNWLQDHPEASRSYGLMAVALVLALMFGWSAEYLGGVAAITGGFIAGLGISRARPTIKSAVDEGVSNIAYAFLVPIFFVNVGLTINLDLFPLEAVPFALILLGIAVFSKIFGCGIGALLGGFSQWDSLRLGVCMISRGEVGLIIAALGVSSGVFRADDPLFPTLFLIILLTTVLTPPLVRQFFPEGSAAHG